MADAFKGEPVQVFLATPEVNSAWAFLEEADTTLPCLLDGDQDVFFSYDPEILGEMHAPYPIHVVIDQEGIVRYLSPDSDPATVRAVIETLLAEQ